MPLGGGCQSWRQLWHHGHRHALRAQGKRALWQAAPVLQSSPATAARSMKGGRRSSRTLTLTMSTNWKPVHSEFGVGGSRQEG